MLVSIRLFSNPLARLIILGSVVLAVTVHSINPAYSARASGSNDYIKLAPHNLYDQPEVKTPSFLELSLKEQNKLLVRNFMEKKYSPLDKSIFREFSILSILGIVPIYGLATSFAKAPGVQNTNSNIGGAMSGGFYGIFASQVFAQFFIVYDAYANRYWNRIEDPLLPLELEYIVKKRFLSVPLSRSIEAQFKAFQVDETRIGTATDAIKIALNLPFSTLEMKYDADLMNTLFEGYPEHLKIQVQSFIFQQILLQDTRHETTEMGTPRAGKRVAGFLYGPPGTGKSRYAELIARAMGVPFAKVSLEGSTLDDFLGRSLESNSPTSGKIAAAMANAKINGQGAKNLVLFIDEADRVINNQHPHSQDFLPFMLKLLDPETKSFYNPFFDTDIDISHLTIILAGNSKIQDEALKKRLFMIHFPGFEIDFKMRIIWNSTIPNLLTSFSQNGKYLLSLSDLLPEDKERINQLITLDKDPGFRTIEAALMYYFSFLAQKKYFDPKAEEPGHIENLILDSNQDLANKAAS